MQTTGTLQSLAPRIVTRKSDGAQFTLYDAIINGTTYQVKIDVFNQSQGLVGQVVQAEVRQEQKGNFTNNYADSILVSAQNAGNAAGALVTQEFIQTAQQAQAASLSAQANKDNMIIRQTACKAAGALLSGSGVGIDLFIDVADKIAKYMETGLKPSEAAVVTTLVSELDAQAQFDADVPF